jgi:hypothetical protein
MLRKYWACAALLVLWSGTAHAEAQMIGPVDLAVRVNGADVPFIAMAVADLTSRGGQFNVDGDVTILASTAILQDRVESIAKTLLPYRLPVDACKIVLTKLTSLVIESQDFEARISAVARISIECGLNDERDIPVKIALMPNLKDKQTLGWKILRKPDIALPTHWWIALELLAGNPQQLFKASVEKMLDADAMIKIPALEGTSVAFKGANFDGNAKELSLRIKGDAHASGAVLTKIMSQFIKIPVLEVTFASFGQ